MIERRREEFISNQTQGKTTLSVFSKAPPTKETKKKKLLLRAFYLKSSSPIIVKHPTTGDAKTYLGREASER